MQQPFSLSRQSFQRFRLSGFRGGQSPPQSQSVGITLTMGKTGHGISHSRGTVTEVVLQKIGERIGIRHIHRFQPYGAPQRKPIQQRKCAAAHVFVLQHLFRPGGAIRVHLHLPCRFRQQTAIVNTRRHAAYRLAPTPCLFVNLTQQLFCLVFHCITPYAFLLVCFPTDINTHGKLDKSALV